MAIPWRLRLNVESFNAVQSQSTCVIVSLRGAASGDVILATATSSDEPRQDALRAARESLQALLNDLDSELNAPTQPKASSS